tara:strand:+ start:37 stop:540 length:504 start_codon:yes stop_codon:yes gene_type:complete
MKKNHNIIDNYLSEEHFKKIYEFFNNFDTAWYYQNKMVTDVNDIEDRGFLSHCVYYRKKVLSSGYGVLEPLLDKIDMSALIQIRANLTFKSEKIYYSPWHNDYGLNNQSTAILYLNTNNGGTEFQENNNFIKSVANRFLIFDGKTLHRSVSQTDENIRLVLNLNFYD